MDSGEAIAAGHWQHSPEQAGLSGLDIDTRSDIHSLGVLLYELLTGTTPLDKTKIKKQAYDEL